MQCMPKYSGISRQAKHITIHHMPSLGKDGESQQAGDEKWITYDNGARKRQWVDKDKSPQPDPKAEFHGRKITLCV